MPRYNTDYSKLVIYKIVCEDSKVEDIYVGHTTDFNNRKNVHKQDCKKYPGCSRSVGRPRDRSGMRCWSARETSGMRGSSPGCGRA